MPRARRASVVVALIAAIGVVACSKLFGDATQCTTDADCAAFAGAVCDVGQAVCVTAPSEIDSGGTVDGSPMMTLVDARHDAPGTLSDAKMESEASSIVDANQPEIITDPCKVTSKPVVVITGTAGTPLTDGGAPTVEITQDLTLTCANDYLLKGDVVVRGATLTVAAGTTVKGDMATHGSLTVMPGAKLNANGTATDPVVFTSSQPVGSRLPNDWRGVFILGNAGPAGKLGGNAALAYGGAAATDSSGTLNDMRVEYSGAALAMAGVGSGTTIDFVQVRRTLDNCFRWSGGTVNAKHVACQAPVAEAFEFTGGYVGKAQFLIAQGAPPTANHEGLLIDGSSVTAYNATLCGSSATYNYGLLPRNTAQMHLANFSITGYSAGFVIYAPMGTPFDLNSSITFGNSENPAYKPDSTVGDMTSPYYDHGAGFDVLAWFGDPTHKNSTTTDPGLGSCLSVPPVFGPAAAITAIAEVQPVDGFFVPAKYVGAVQDVNDAWPTGTFADWTAQ